MAPQSKRLSHAGSQREDDFVHEAVHKKNLFPVQRVAKIEASWAAAIFFSTFYFFP